MRILRVVGLVVLVASVGLIGYWAGRTALEPPDNPLDENPSHVLYTVAEDTVGRSFSFTAVGQWEVLPVGYSGSSGVVTSRDVSDGDMVSAGDVLYTVDLRGVVAAEGAVPMFRPLRLRAEGRDVAQLQGLLAELGYYEGDLDGSFGSSTRAAVREWQDALGWDDDGEVRTGDIVFVPSLPNRVVLEASVIPGARLGEGDLVLSALPEAPGFHIPIAPERANLVPLDADVEVTYAEGVWTGRVEQVVENEQNELQLILVGDNGTTLCGDDCADWVDLTAPTDFRANVIVVPETTGAAVPVAGISSDPGNNAFVTLAGGTMSSVLVLATANGLAIVEGIESGTQIRLPADP